MSLSAYPILPSPPTDQQPPTGCVAITATFTAEPVETTLRFWMAELLLPWTIDFAPYDQVFQQLLDRASLLRRNSRGANVILLRVEDWQRAKLPESGQELLAETLTRNADDLIHAVQSMVARSSTPLLISICPASAIALAMPGTADLFSQIERRIIASLDGIPGVALIRPEDFAAYPVGAYDDPLRDQLGHIPYRPAFFAALGTILSRRIHALTSRPYKVIALDCDNTIWRGIVGEDGLAGITIPPAWEQLQRRLVDLASQGFLLCLCSKNEEADVLDVFDQRADMVLKREHLISWRVNWRPKSQNIRELATELNLGLDSFVFLDDNPVECAEVQAGCPEVVALRLPVEGDITHFLDHVWPFDRLQVTSEDRQRTVMYKQEVDRARFLKQARTIEEFIAGLGLSVEISGPVPTQLARVAQLTQRTNQFNFTTRHRTDSEIRALCESALECRVVTVADRFGDYGLVGVLIFAVRGQVMEVDTFLLSCRVLGRGVEHRMLKELGRIAQTRGISLVELVCIPTKKNQPARDFLESVAAGYQVDGGGQLRYRIPADQAAIIAYTPRSTSQNEGSDGTATEPARATTTAEIAGRSQRFQRIASELSSARQVLQAVQARYGAPRARARFGKSFIAPRSEIEMTLAKIWAEVLRFDSIGVRDHFFDMGGTSLLAVDLIAQIERRFAKKLPLTSLLQRRRSNKSPDW